MRVLHVQKATGIAGSERHLLDLLPGLAERGIGVAMCVLSAPGSDRFTDALRARGVEALTIPAGRHVTATLPLRLARTMRAWRPDVVHAHLVHASVYGVPAARLVGRPAVMSAHEALPFHRREPYRTAMRVAGHLATRTIAISEHVARSLRTQRLAPVSRVRIVPYGIDPDLWTVRPAERQRLRGEWGVGPEGVVVGVASRLVPGKGHDVLLAAFERALGVDADLKLVVAGDGPWRPQVERRVAQLPSGSAMTLGFVPDIRAFMSACDVVVVPTLKEMSEGFGLVALEAMASARPVIATRVGSLPEVVDDETGCLVPPGDAFALADALSSLGQDTERRRRLGGAARARAVAMFPLASMIDTTVRIYREVLER